MRNIETINTKGETNVKTETNSDVSGEKIFNSAEADVIRDESKWNAFQLMGDTNSEEQNHIATPPKDYIETSRASQERKMFINERLRRLGGKVTAVYNYSLR